MKKYAWIITLLAALSLAIFGIGCDNGTTNTPPGPPPTPPSGDLEITDATEIGALLSGVHLYNGTSPETVIATDNVAHFNFPTDADIDNHGFKVAFPAEAVGAGFLAMEITFKLIEVTTLDEGEFVKLGFKETAFPDPKEDMTPYADYELWFGTPAGGSIANGEGSEQTIRIPLYQPNKAPSNATWFTHNKYAAGSGPFNGKKGSDGPINYKVEITKIKFEGGTAEACCDDCDEECDDCQAGVCSDECGTVCCLPPLEIPAHSPFRTYVNMAVANVSTEVQVGRAGQAAPAAPETAPVYNGNNRQLTVVTDAENQGVTIMLTQAQYSRIAAVFDNNEKVDLSLTIMGAGEARAGLKDPDLTANWNGSNLPSKTFTETPTTLIAELEKAGNYTGSNPEILSSFYIQFYTAGTYRIDNITLSCGSTSIIVDGEDVAIDMKDGIDIGSAFSVVALDNGLVVSGGNWDWAMVKIKVDLGDLTLGEVTKVKFDLEGVDGDSANYKNYNIFAGAAARPIPGGQINAAYLTTNAIAAQISSSGGSNGTLIPFEFTINQTKITELGLSGASEIEFAIWANMNNVTYIMYDIEFVGGGTPYVTPVVDNFAITLAAPVKGAAAPTAIGTHDQFTGAVTWAPAVDGTFAAGTAYTATIALTAKTGFTLEGLTNAAAFTITGATVTYNASTKTVTAVFPATEAAAGIAVTLNSVTQVGGSASTATTALTLTFSAAITGLSANDITLSAGATKGALSGSGPAYTLAVTGITNSTTLTVTIGAKDGYDISGGVKTVDVYKGGAVFEFVSFTGVTFTGGGGNPTEYFAGNAGIQRAGESWAVTDGKLVFTPGAGDYKSVKIQVGTAAGGTDNYWNNTNGFAPVTDGIYKITVVASADSSGSGTMRVQPNGDYRQAVDLTLTAEAKTVSLIWTQGAGNETEKNLELGNIQTQKGFVVHSIRIEGFTVPVSAYWEIPDFTGLTVSDNEYVGNTGLQNGNKSDTAIEIDGSDLKIKATNGTYKTVKLQTGTAAGGTNYFTSEGFVAAIGKTYRIVVEASGENTNGRLRLRDGSRTGDNDWTSFNLTTTPTEYVYMWTQTTGNFSIDTGGTPTNENIIISSIVIYELN